MATSLDQPRKVRYSGTAGTPKPGATTRRMGRGEEPPARPLGSFAQRMAHIDLIHDDIKQYLEKAR